MLQPVMLKKAEVKRFYEDLQDLVELTLKAFSNGLTSWKFLLHSERYKICQMLWRWKFQVLGNSFQKKILSWFFIVNKDHLILQLLILAFLHDILSYSYLHEIQDTYFNWEDQSIFEFSKQLTSNIVCYQG